MVNIDRGTATDVNGNVDEVNGNNDVPEVPEESTYTNLSVCFLCAEPATFVCDKCGLVAFCSEAHQKLHR